MSFSLSNFMVRLPELEIFPILGFSIFLLNSWTSGGGVHYGVKVGTLKIGPRSVVLADSEDAL